MAESGVSENDLTNDLKNELHRLVKAIIQESSSDNQNEFAENVHRAIQTLQILGDLKKGGKQEQPSSSSIEIDNRIVGFFPQEFNCPLSKNIMTDPVIVSTGTTYDRSSIQKWLKEGNRTCPITRQLISNPNPTPNLFVRDMISKWCKNHGVPYPSPNRPSLLVSLLKTLSSGATLPEQKEAAKALRSLTKRLPAFRAYFSESKEFTHQLLAPLAQPETEPDPDLHQDVITTLMNLSIHETNEKMVAETPMVIPILLEALRSGTIETRSNAAATLYTLSALDANKSLIGRYGALKPLIHVLDEGDSFVMKDVGSTILNLCSDDENKERAVESGVVRVVLKKIEERLQVDELVEILEMLADHHKAVVEMADLGAVCILFSLIKEACVGHIKEDCIAVVYRICFKDESKWEEMREEEGRYGTISEIAKTESSMRAIRKANAILDRINSVNSSSEP